LLAGVVTAALGLAVGNALFVVMRVPAEVALLGRAYLGTWVLGAPLVFGFFALEAAFRASGDTRTPFLMLASSVLLNAALDPLLIMGVGPLPELGVRGAAAASVMVRGLAFLLGLAVALRRGLLAWRAPDWRAVPTVVRVGAPLSLAGVVLSLIYVWLTRYTSRFGTEALAALGIGHKMEGLGFIAITGFALAAGALVGQNLGAGHEERARRAVRLTVSYCLIVTVTTSIAFLVAPRALVGLFSADPGVIDAGSLYLRIITIAQIGQTFELIFEGALAGAGYTVVPMIVSTGLTALRIPLSAWGSQAFGLAGIWWALSLTAAARGAAMTLFWRGGAWRRSVV
jgi:putative MATE family efflux protein